MTAAAKIVDLKIEAIRPRRLYQQVAQQIERLILGGAFAVGDRLPPEQELSRQFQVSRPTIREALIALEVAGVVEVRNGNGSFVLALPAQARSNDQGPGPFEQFEARELIECEVAARAAQLITPETIAELEALVAEMERNYPHARLADSEGFRFHVTLAKSCGNSYLAAAVEELWTLRSGEMWFALRNRLLRTSHRQHAIESRRMLIDALRRRDSNAARAAMTRMLSRAKELYFEE